MSSLRKARAEGKRAERARWRTVFAVEAARHNLEVAKTLLMTNLEAAAIIATLTALPADVANSFNEARQ